MSSERVLSTPVLSTPVGSAPIVSAPVGSTTVGSTTVGSTPVGSTTVGSTPVGSDPDRALAPEAPVRSHRPVDDPTAPAGSAAVDPPRPVWSQVTYDLPAGNDPLRSATWRALRDLHAVNVGPRTWAVPACGVATMDRLDALARAVDAAGGSTSVEAVGTEPDDAVRHARLNRSCERLWDDLFDAADCAVLARSGEVRLDDVVDDLIDLRRRYHETVVFDLVWSAAARTAERRLADEQALVWELLRVERQPGRCRADVRLVAAWDLVDGTRAHVAALDPVPDPRWDLGLLRFEDFAYLPDPARVPLRHGAFRWIGSPDDTEVVLAGLRRRVERFELSLLPTGRS